MKEPKPTRERRKAYYAYADMYGQEAADERCAEPNDSWYAVGMGMCAGFISFLFMFMAASDAMNGDGGELYAVIGLLAFLLAILSLPLVFHYERRHEGSFMTDAEYAAKVREERRRRRREERERSEWMASRRAQLDKFNRRYGITEEKDA